MDINNISARFTRAFSCWNGHVVRMPDHRSPKQIFYSKLVEGKRPEEAFQRCAESEPQEVQQGTGLTGEPLS